MKNEPPAEPRMPEINRNREATRLLETVQEGRIVPDPERPNFHD